MNLLFFNHTNPLVSGLAARHEDDYYCSTSNNERKSTFLSGSSCMLTWFMKIFRGAGTP
jgi:hypothetical protein